MILPARLASFREYGFALVKDHGIDSALIDQAWALTAQFFAMPEEEKRKYFIPGIGGARGYTPFKTEIAKGAKLHDLKEFWHVGRDVPADSLLASSMPPNVWPDRPKAFRTSLRASMPNLTRRAPPFCRASRCIWGWTKAGSIRRSRTAIR
jgi:isopenicillin N synthase-like dioxygenase